MTNEIEVGRRVDDKRASGPVQWGDTQVAAEKTEAADISRDVMLDIETLGREPGCVVLSIGAVTFGPDGLGERFYAAASLSSSVEAGLKIDPDTLTWWLNQSREAQDAAFPSDAYALPHALLMFTDWYLARNPEHVWCHGATFDVPIMDAAYRACDQTPPWRYWSVRDTRTLYDLAGISPDRSKGTHHNALDDAVAQAEAAVKALRILRARADGAKDD